MSNWTSGQIVTAAQLTAAFAEKPAAADLANQSDPTKGAALIGFDLTNLVDFFRRRLLKNVNSFAELRGISGSAFTRIYVSGGSALNDGQQGAFYVDPADTTTPDDNATVIVNPVDGTRFKRQYIGAAKNSWWLAKNDRTTDDTAANQAAINYCLSFAQPKPLKIMGPSLLTASLNIDRPVDTTSGNFRIIGAGAFGGFYVTTAITMIDSTISMPGTDPVSEFVSFEDMHFECSNAATAALVISKKFLRVMFRGCTFEKIACANMGTAYAQTFRFLNNRIRKWAGYFFASSGSFDMDFAGNIAEAGGAFFRSYDSTNTHGTVGVRFRGNLYEGSSGSFIEAGLVQGLAVVGNYLEANSGLTMNLFVSSQQNSGVHFAGNSIVSSSTNKANSAFYEVQWGNTIAAKSEGNRSDGRLHDQSAMSADALSIDADYAGIELFKGNKTGLTDANRTGITGKVRGYDATGNLLYIANGMGWVALDGTFGGIAATPAVNNGGVLVPVRFCFGSANPQSSPATYGNPYWAVGSRVTNSAPAVGSPKGWVCTVSGQPGTWVSEGNL
ncbi:hypothetical protein [Ralstonia wenshanensis]|uniref:hypothetical protein n=1 Tax=Ralstonia wenshanensis TaxID=2842456 RepID=UPI003D96A19B